MDIADAFYNQHSVAWLSGLGISSPQPFSDKGFNWLRTFGGGLLVTCGLTHIGAPESDEFGERGLHGSISNIPAEIRNQSLYGTEKSQGEGTQIQLAPGEKKIYDLEIEILNSKEELKNL